MSDVLSIPRSRVSDPLTSVEAGEAAASFLSAHHAAILKTMREAGRPLAAQEIATILQWSSHHPVNRRLPELVKLKLIVRTEERFTNESGRGAFKYELVESTGG